MNLSKNFTLAEMTVSQTAARRGIDNNPSPEAIENLSLLCENVLQPVRDHFNAPVVVTSGYRSPKLNRAIGGSKTSEHSFGMAADFTVAGVPNKLVLEFMQANLVYGQLIDEFHRWIHVSYNEANQRNQELKARRVRGRTRYTPTSFL